MFGCDICCHPSCYYILSGNFTYTYMLKQQSASSAGKRMPHHNMWGWGLRGWAVLTVASQRSEDLHLSVSRRHSRRREFIWCALCLKLHCEICCENESVPCEDFAAAVNPLQYQGFKMAILLRMRVRIHTVMIYWWQHKVWWAQCLHRRWRPHYD